VFTRKPGLLRRRNRAVTLIEAVLYISIALALIVGGLVFYQQASTAARTTTMVRQLSALVAETRVLIKGQPLPTATVLNGGLTRSDVLDITAFLISAGAVPPDMVRNATTLSNPFGGTTTVNAFLFNADGPVVFISLTNVPQSVCVRLLTASSGQGGTAGTTLVSNGYIRGGAENGNQPVSQRSIFWTKPFIMNVTQAGWMCRYGGNDYTNQNTQPNTTPISGNVNVFMFFLVEG
jgi:hypothetical protein